MLRYAGSSLKKDKTFMLKAVSLCGWALEWADAFLKKDEEVVFTAVFQHFEALYSVDESFKNDKRVVLAAISSGGGAISYAAPALKKEKDVVVRAIRTCPKAIGLDVDEVFKKDKDIALLAISEIPWILEKFDPELRNDKGLIEASKIRDNVERANRCAEIYRAVHDIDGSSYEACYQHLMNDNFFAFQFMPECVRADITVAMDVISFDGTLICFASDELRNNYRLALVAVCQCPSAFKYLSENLQKNVHLISLSKLVLSSERQDKLNSIMKHFNGKSAFFAYDAREPSCFDGRLCKSMKPVSVAEDVPESLEHSFSSMS